MYSKLENFLLDNKLNDELFDYQAHEYKVHKEKYDDRFDILYGKQNSRELRQRRSTYDLFGYYDKKDHCIYEANSFLHDKLQESQVIKFNSFSQLDKQILEDLKKYLSDYIFSHEKELKKLAMDKYEAKDDSRLFDYKKEVNKYFITQKESDIEISIPAYDSDVAMNMYDGNKTTSYLDNPKNTIEEMAIKIIEKRGEELGLELLIYYDKLEYLKGLTENKNHEHDDIHDCKKILDSIKYVDAKTVNITIHYGENSYTFKYELQALITSLTNGRMSSSSYNNSYGKVNEFLRDNDKTGYNQDKWRNEFLFSHITSITNGKTELYNKDILDNNKEIEEDLEIEI